MSLSESISTLCEGIERSQNERSQSIIQTKEDVVKAREDFQRMMSNLHNERIKSADQMRRFLHNENMKMAKDTSDLLTKFMKERCETQKEMLKSREEILEAFNIWRSFFIGRKRTKPFARAIPSIERSEEPASPKSRLGRRKSRK